MTKRGRRPAGLDRWIRQAVLPVFAINQQRRCVFFNHGFEQLTGWKPEDLVGRICEYHSQATDDIERLTAALCPPPEVMTGSPATVPVLLSGNKRPALSCTVHFFPLMNSEQNVDRIVGIILESDGSTKPTVAVSATQVLHAELASLRQSLRRRYRVESFVARSAGMQRVLRQIESARNSRFPVLIRGPAGSGCEHVARTVHHAAAETGGTFVPMDCSLSAPMELRRGLTKILLPETRESQPLGPRTVFLKHVDRLPDDLQTLLSDSIQNESGPRILASSTAFQLEKLNEDDSFSSPLFFLLTTMVIEVPALRERREDLPLLAQHFLEHHNRGNEQQIGGLAESTIQRLSEYNWPGNLDELHEVIREARELCPTDTIQPEHLPFRFRTGMDHQSTSPRRRIPAYSLDVRLADIESGLIREMLVQCRFNKAAVAQNLGISRTRLYRRIDQLGLSEELELLENRTGPE